jgi:hypothetical protein
MTINLFDPTPLTPTEALFLLIDARQHVNDDRELSIFVIGHASTSLRVAEYRLCKEANELKGWKM